MNNIEQQARWWKYAAWTAPFVALAILIGEELLGFESAIGVTSVIITTTFITTSVFWWWWAISKITFLMKRHEVVEENFKDLKNDIKEIKKDVGDWEWREPS
jgi:ABC-type uncharacterized transport system involved in gliding motility auxiliary subunit